MDRAASIECLVCSAGCIDCAVCSVWSIAAPVGRLERELTSIGGTLGRSCLLSVVGSSNHKELNNAVFEELLAVPV